jgi:hypothetical protein
MPKTTKKTQVKKTQVKKSPKAEVSRDLKTRTNVKAGGRSIQHNLTLAR